MFDHLRQQSSEADDAEEQEEQEEEPLRPLREYAPAVSAGSGGSERLFGLTPLQRFVIALMLFLNITVLGCFALIAFEKIMLPF